MFIAHPALPQILATHLNLDELEFLVYHNSDLKDQNGDTQGSKNKVKKILHADNRRNLTRVKKRAQDHVFWPSMNTFF